MARRSSDEAWCTMHNVAAAACAGRSHGPDALPAHQRRKQAQKPAARPQRKRGR